MATTTLLIGSGEPSIHRCLAVLLPEAECRQCWAWDLPSHAGWAEILAVDGATVDEGLLRLAPRLRLVQVLGPSAARIDLEACGRRGVYVASVPWGIRTGQTGFARLVELGEPPPDEAGAILARVVAGNARRLVHGLAPLFWVNPPAWMDADQALHGRAAVARSMTA